MSRKSLQRLKICDTFYKALIFPLCNYTKMNGVDALQTFHPNYYNLIVRSVTFFDCSIAHLELKLMEKNKYDKFMFVLKFGKKETMLDSVRYDIDQIVLIYLSILHKWDYPYVGQVLARCSFEKLSSVPIEQSYNYIMYNLILQPNKKIINYKPSRVCRDSKNDFTIYSSLRGLYLQNTNARKRINLDISFALNKYAHGCLHRRNCTKTQCGECVARFCKRFVCDDVAQFIGNFVFVRKPQT